MQRCNKWGPQTAIWGPKTTMFRIYMCCSDSKRANRLANSKDKIKGREQNNAKFLLLHIYI